MAPAVTVVIVRTRVGFGGKFGRRWSSCAGVRTVDLRPKRSLLATLATLSSINFNQPPEAKPIAQARLSGLLWLPGTTAAGSDGPCGLKAPS